MISCFPLLYFSLRPRKGHLHPLLDPPKEKAMTVEFRAILPKEAWEWNEDSTVYIRFMFGEEYGDIGPGIIDRYRLYYSACQGL